TVVFGVVMRGEATPAQIAALLMGLRVKGETPEEVAGAARALRDAMIPVEAAGDHLVDTCGTGGGTVSTFNISTAAAFVAAGGAGRAVGDNVGLARGRRVSRRRRGAGGPGVQRGGGDLRRGHRALLRRRDRPGPAGGRHRGGASRLGAAAPSRSA